jgi:hypothetical protein
MRLADRSGLVIVAVASVVVSAASSRSLPPRGQAVASISGPAPPGQTQVPKRGTGLIVGQVIDGTTGKPVGGALVTLSIAVVSLAGRGQPVPSGLTVLSSSSGRVFADSEGRFVFHDLPAGSANLSASALGYTPGSYGAKRPNDAPRSIVLGEAERVGEATIRIWKLAAISGTVVDESGDPLVGVSVSALRYTAANGVRRTAGGPTTTTDDRGAYHFIVTSGDYAVVVPTTSTSTPRSSIDAFQQAITVPGQAATLMQSLNSSGAPMPNDTGFRVGTMQLQASGALARNAPTPTDSGPVLAYQTTYYPAALVPTQAQTITVAPGDDHPNVDVTMRLVATERVMGSVFGPDGSGGNLGVRLVTAESRDSSFNSSYPTANTISEASGAFTFLGVPSGQYELQVTRIPRPDIISGMPAATSPLPTLWARTPVSVGSTDIAGLTIALRTGVRVSGRVEFDGSAPRPAPERLATVSVILQDIDGLGQGIMPARLSPDGQFTTSGVIPGRYLAVLGGTPGGGWSLKSLTANGRDLSAAPQVFEGDITSAILTLTDHPNRLDGSVEMQSSADTQPAVVFFPAHYEAWLAGGTAGRLSRFIRVDGSGRFTSTGLPAGDYFIAAIPSDLANDWQDPKILEAISRGATRISMSDDEHKSVDLKPLTIR